MFAFLEMYQKLMGSNYHLGYSAEICAYPTTLVFQ